MGIALKSCKQELKQYNTGEPCDISSRCLEGWEDGHYMILHNITKQTERFDVQVVGIIILRPSYDVDFVSFLSQMPKTVSGGTRLARRGCMGEAVPGYG